MQVKGSIIILPALLVLTDGEFVEFFRLQPHQFDRYFILASIMNFIPPAPITSNIYTAVERRMNIQRAFSYNVDNLLVKN